MRDEVVITTQSGRVRGARVDSVVCFKGIPYAEPPVGSRRFRSPTRARSWVGIRDALQFGPAPIQEPTLRRAYPFGAIDSTSEDCLTLNVWTPVDAVQLPVIVWIHGGGFRTGAGSMPAYDGVNYAATGRVVFVSINYRLGALGFLAHESLRDPDTGAFANWAIQDQVLALRWVQENIAAFGGDPRQVTVMGESGGAINAIMIAHGTQGRSLLQRIIAMSPPYICPPATMDINDWHLAAESVARELGTTVPGLRDVPAEAVHAAEWRQYVQGALKTRSGRAYRGTAVDGVVLDAWPIQHSLPLVPMIIGCTAAEGAMGYECYHPISKEPISRSRVTNDALAARAEARALLNRLYYIEGDEDAADEVVAHYLARAKTEGRRDDMIRMLVELNGDTMIRHYCVRQAEQAARSGRTDIFFYHYGLPVAAPNHEPPHAWELPVAFGTHRNPVIAPWVGNGPLHDAVATAMIEAFSTFAASGRPGAAELPDWPAFRAPGSGVMLLGEGDTVGRVAELPKYAQLRVLDSLAARRP
ncbi:MAG TPA: carboxylesterase family protein [Steroidobacteraceae bacterium]|jgi:para-nitrobenzyl esterase